ncbi:hypothetical protein CEUSTIGMA_g10500.t1 [Chlamydomonas eustigma]|uniref:Uncharacterized protein n=1 Tax=Chlamydomonas eustigma TaxID=1157962 RepID=A0A250XJ19_9CHLO|nr:hypothetical protein CEUSTIGMA_g10500.t1 [Chlamydomonas eustigma]|eukprot:GAX83074.1 hypothetical protein CEUSTIGMA_g10500.t1 [Chlamydomonas eustigma]
MHTTCIDENPHTKHPEEPERPVSGYSEPPVPGSHLGAMPESELVEIEEEMRWAERSLLASQAVVVLPLRFTSSLTEKASVQPASSSSSHPGMVEEVKQHIMSVQPASSSHPGMVEEVKQHIMSAASNLQGAIPAKHNSHLTPTRHTSHELTPTAHTLRLAAADNQLPSAVQKDEAGSEGSYQVSAKLSSKPLHNSPMSAAHEESQINGLSKDEEEMDNLVAVAEQLIKLSSFPSNTSSPSPTCAVTTTNHPRKLVDLVAATLNLEVLHPHPPVVTSPSPTAAQAHALSVALDDASLGALPSHHLPAAAAYISLLSDRGHTSDSINSEEENKTVQSSESQAGCSDHETSAQEREMGCTPSSKDIEASLTTSAVQSRNRGTEGDIPLDASYVQQANTVQEDALVMPQIVSVLKSTEGEVEEGTEWATAQDDIHLPLSPLHTAHTHTPAFNMIATADLDSMDAPSANHSVKGQTITSPTSLQGQGKGSSTLEAASNLWKDSSSPQQGGGEHQHVPSGTASAESSQTLNPKPSAAAHSPQGDHVQEQQHPHSLKLPSGLPQKDLILMTSLKKLSTLSALTPPSPVTRRDLKHMPPTQSPPPVPSTTSHMLALNPEQPTASVLTFDITTPSRHSSGLTEAAGLREDKGTVTCSMREHHDRSYTKEESLDTSKPGTVLSSNPSSDHSATPRQKAVSLDVDTEPPDLAVTSQIGKDRKLDGHQVFLNPIALSQLPPGSSWAFESGLWRQTCKNSGQALQENLVPTQQGSIGKALNENSVPTQQGKLISYQKNLSVPTHQALSSDEHGRTQVAVHEVANIHHLEQMIASPRMTHPADSLGKGDTIKATPQSPSLLIPDTKQLAHCHAIQPQALKQGPVGHTQADLKMGSDVRPVASNEIDKLVPPRKKGSLKSSMSCSQGSPTTSPYCTSSITPLPATPSHSPSPETIEQLCTPSQAAPPHQTKQPHTNSSKDSPFSSFQLLRNPTWPFATQYQAQDSRVIPRLDLSESYHAYEGAPMASNQTPLITTTLVSDQRSHSQPSSISPHDVRSPSIRPPLPIRQVPSLKGGDQPSSSTMSLKSGVASAPVELHNAQHSGVKADSAAENDTVEVSVDCADHVSRVKQVSQHSSKLTPTSNTWRGPSLPVFSAARHLRQYALRLINMKPGAQRGHNPVSTSFTFLEEIGRQNDPCHVHAGSKRKLASYKLLVTKRDQQLLWLRLRGTVLALVLHVKAEGRIEQVGEAVGQGCAVVAAGMMGGILAHASLSENNKLTFLKD